MNYKKTLNLPKTKFPMKANLTYHEPKQLALWEAMELYACIIKKSKNKKTFTMHDGPPYANGNIHIGTAMNKILKDITVRSRQMFGFKAEYIPGWDCHGLPIEHNVDKELGCKKKNMTQTQIRRRCRKYADNFVNVHMEEFKRLGVMAEWDNPYLTMDHRYEAIIARECYNFAKNGSLFRSKKPIHWCCSCGTALAEAEIEYGYESSPSIYVRFPIKNCNYVFPELKHQTVSMVIWTTTPWTLPANLAVALHPELIYSAVEVPGGDILIMAKDLVKECMSKFGIASYISTFEFNAKRLENQSCLHPISGRSSLIIMAGHVTTDTGTGCVHTAPGHGREDYDVGRRYGLEPYCPVDAEGIFTDEEKTFQGQFILDANSNIIEKLAEKQNLLAEEEIMHSYPHCWRCKKPVIFRATPQWFISMDKTELRKKAICAIDSVNWIPHWGHERIKKMLESRPDWCVSRQRVWGVPIAIFYCNDCGELYINDAIIEHIFLLFSNHGADIWFEKRAGDLMPKKCVCKQCGSKNFSKENDILDVWFDSGVSHIAVLEDRPNLEWPADLYIEGSDQHRGWFQSSLLTSLGTRGAAPYKSVLTHGFVVDADGKKMSKSIGNIVSPKTVIEKYGAEILRLWVAASDYKDDVRISEDILKQLSDAYRRIRNTSRFLLGNLNDFDPLEHKIDYTEMPDIDRYALHKLQEVLKQVSLAYEAYEFHTIYHKLYDYCTSDLSAFYLDIIKDRLYTTLANSPERRSAQTTMYKILDTISRVMAPILIFTSEEIWQHMPDLENKVGSIHLLNFPEVDQNMIDSELSRKWDTILTLRSEVLRALEQARANKIIGHSLGALVTIALPNLKKDTFKLISEYEAELKLIFIVSKVILVIGKGDNNFIDSKILNGLSIKVEPYMEPKCDRCWVHDDTVGKSSKHPTICSKCANIIQKISEL